MQLPISGQ